MSLPSFGRRPVSRPPRLPLALRPSADGMLIEGMHNEAKKSYQDANGGFLDVCEWTRVECTEDHVISIDFSWDRMNEKQFPFEFIPALTQKFEMISSNMHGTLDTGVLPLDLFNIDVSRNELHGELSFRKFPRKLEKIDIGINDFCGSCRLSDLPDTLIVFTAKENRLSGSVFFDDLPAAMESLDLSYNELSGSISIERLPQSMVCICLIANEFTGELRLMSFPPSLEGFYILQNNLSERAILRKASGKMHFFMPHSCIKSVLDEDGNTHKWQKAIRNRIL